MLFEVQIIGSNSAVADHGRYPTAQVVYIHDKVFLVDCGEGTQMRLKHFKVKRSRIERIFISHLHGDHYFGLIGMITSYHLLGRTAPLFVYGPAELQQIIELQLKLGSTQLRYPLTFIAVNPFQKETIFEDEDVEVISIPVKHRINTTGFIFKEKVFPRKINRDTVIGLNLQSEDYLALREGKDVELEDGTTHENEALTLSGPAARTYAFISDTLFHPAIADEIKGVDLLYHEATFINEQAVRANETFHSTSGQAAEMAKLANAKRLLIGHFSSRYIDLLPLLAEAKEVFSETALAIEGEVFEV